MFRIGFISPAEPRFERRRFEFKERRRPRIQGDTTKRSDAEDDPAPPKPSGPGI